MAGDSGVQPGQVVRSTAGRDRGRYYVVIRRLNERFVAVADGRARRSAWPKKKNVRHLEPVGDQGSIAANPRRLGDEELQQALSRFDD